MSCKYDSSGMKDVWKKEILETEQNFALMAKEKGVAKAFLAFADDNAVLQRNNNLVIGRGAIEAYYQNQGIDENVNLNWKPEFVDVSESGDLGYTYGYYTFTFMDSTNKQVINKGVFHTVWKKQEDGSWKFIWD